MPSTHFPDHGPYDRDAKADRVVLVSASTGAPIDPEEIGGEAPSAATGATTSVAAATSATTLKAANVNRLGLTVYNDSTATLYLLLGAGTVSSTVYTVQLAPGAYYETPFRFTGAVTGIWSAANGNARITEITA